MTRSEYMDLEENLLRNRTERSRIDRSIHRILKAADMLDEADALGCLYAALLKKEDADIGSSTAAVNEARDALLPADSVELVAKLTRRLESAELKAGILWDLGLPKAARLTTPELGKLLAELTAPGSGEHVLNAGGGWAFMNALFARQPDLDYAEINEDTSETAMAVLRASLLDFRSAAFPESLDTAAYDKALVVPDMGSWKTGRIGSEVEADPLFTGHDVSGALRGWNKIAEVLRAVRPGGTVIAGVQTDLLVSSREAEVRQFFTERNLLKMVVVLPRSRFGKNLVSCLLVLGTNDSGIIRFINTLSGSQTDLDDQAAETWAAEILSDERKTREIRADVTADAVRSEGYNWFPIRYMLPEICSNIRPLGDIVHHVQRGAQVKRESLDDYISDEPTSVRCIYLSDLKDGILRADDMTAVYLTQLPESLKSHVIPHHALVLAKMSLSGSELRSAVVENDTDVTLVAMDNMYVLKLDEEQVLPYYLQSYFASRDGAASLQSVSSGAVALNLSRSNLLQLPVPLPPMERQQEIGEEYRETACECLDLRRQIEQQESKLKDIWRQYLP
ncbi:MAG: hypothetical protein HDQ87_09540 [Clostridia bacterium]|nr:hypothetical protein [Clostridia bacterium]